MVDERIEMKRTRILHLLSCADMGGIEMLCRSIAEYSTDENDFCLLYRGGILEDKIAETGSIVYPLYHCNIFMRYIKLFLLMKKRNYDTVIVHHEGKGIYLFFIFLTYLFPHKKYVKYLHCAYDKEMIKDCLEKMLLCISLNKADLAIAVSEYVRDSYCSKLDIIADKITILYNGSCVKISDLETVRENRHEKMTRLLYIGRVVKIKGVQTLLRAIEILLSQGYQLQLDILGDGTDMLQCKKLCEELEIEDSVHFRGVVMAKEKYYSDADIFIYPSLCKEAFGISIVEAMAHGLICVASNVGGIPEIIEDGVSGYLVESNNTHALAEKIELAIKICRNDSRNNMSRRAVSRACEFDIENMIQKFHQLVENKK